MGASRKRPKLSFNYSPLKKSRLPYEKRTLVASLPSVNEVFRLSTPAEWAGIVGVMMLDVSVDRLDALVKRVEDRTSMAVRKRGILVESRAFGKGFANRTTFSRMARSGEEEISTGFPQCADACVRWR